MFKQIVSAGLIVLLLGLTSFGWAEISAEQKQQILKMAKSKLDGSTWQVELKQMAAGSKKKEKITEDTISFTGGRVESAELVSQGFSRTNFTVRLKRDNTIIWETMQTSEENGLAFWRGEVRDGTMRGVLSWHLNEKKIKDYNFVSEKQDLVLIPTEEEMVTAQVAEKKAVEKRTAEKKAAAKKAAQAKAAAKKAAAKKAAVEKKDAGQPEKEEAEEEKSEKKKGWFWGR